MSQTATVLVSEAKKVKSGQSARGEWTLFSIIDGNEDRYSTFDHSLFKTAEGLQGRRAEIEYEADERGKTLKGIKEASSENGDAPKPGTGEYVTGQKPQIEARRIFASTAWNCAVKLAEVEFKMMPLAQEITPARVYEAAKKHVDAIFLDLTRKGDAIRDEDLPFLGNDEGQ